ncbi:hypothetical protein SAMN05216188_11873 [Lentzea xinjiangensis]|uniref:Uncharacterized protein n=1 Tax=Lentzea xinjiangensis TaxID=402600 RepID=A0A1H9TFH9_9PSEU|nr:hypothetical protein [Lentzea xinjiangensis]SER95589.1 hypothetical protein SAMN05216188_11873 [Lentzea xinjiangensis]
MTEDEFVPCRPGCWTCKPGPWVTAGAMRWTPTGAPYPVGPSVEPYRGRPIAPEVRGLEFHGAYVDEIAAMPERPEPKPVPRRPLVAGLIRRLHP